MSTVIRKNFPYLIAFGIVALIGVLLVAGYALAQEAEEETGDDCRWDVESIMGEGVQNSHSVNALFWNDCTGEILHLGRGSQQGDLFELRLIQEAQ